MMEAEEEEGAATLEEEWESPDHHKEECLTLLGRAVWLFLSVKL